MRKNYLLIITGLLLLSAILYAFKPQPVRIKYQYITIIVRDDNLNEVLVSIDGKDYSKTNLNRQSKGHWDMNPILNIIHQYEDEGYELQSFSGTGLFTYFWLRKQKEG